ncbi:anhydro-N-acetylmuramic acid kinase [candidate division KSB1 bacterium]|nr:anhydro-N-acetylmuramic acid kinase [candidate division KSB1 bacterium]NIR72484.1 anhydro-N-acetylmuramic acid kinase [candidate division KSB1 bacterium]NIS24069.1 anhydro-N-acetylmuramic acid kinase [candidate division KSB1 bacterium]NIT70988.1 anhydro-N-acetylmuramic acid kinase [candidate division KSB1 bacterium]NIU27399.1 anhydro-N-acetylmuramic acid kinase [candidate division KSB1 bacterium]
MPLIQKLAEKNPRLGVGLISGTSIDGVDAALVEVYDHGFQTKIELLHFLTHPYPDGLKNRILEISTPGKGTTEEICQMNVLLGEIFATAALKVIRGAKAAPESVDFIGSHGQTVQHWPQELERFGYKVRSTLQLGEPSVIARRTGILTVADFRPADMAMGGQGAPLVPYLDFVLFRSSEKSRALLNIGGIANLTVVRQNCRLEDVVAFDTGPGNMLIDALMMKLFDQSYDDDGKVAQSGSVSQKLLEAGLRHPYFEQPPPKSTGREEFGQHFLEKFMAEANILKLDNNDIVATASELTASSIWQSYQKHVMPNGAVNELIVSGGGSRNGFLINSLKEKFQDTPVRPIDDFGIPSDAKEAVCFAVLANETIFGVPNNVPSATGASQPTVLGKICI